MTTNLVSKYYKTLMELSQKYPLNAQRLISDKNVVTRTIAN
jgi:hypothetical protein